MVVTFDPKAVSSSTEKHYLLLTCVASLEILPSLSAPVNMSLYSDVATLLGWDSTFPCCEKEQLGDRPIDIGSRKKFWLNITPTLWMGPWGWVLPRKHKVFELAIQERIIQIPHLGRGQRQLKRYPRAKPELKTSLSRGLIFQPSDLGVVTITLI